MITFSKQQAEELNELFEFFLRERHGRTGFYEPYVIYKRTSRLKDSDDVYVEKLLFIVRELQRENIIPILITGANLLDVNKPALRPFLNVGGFIRIYKEIRAKKRHPVIKWVLETIFKTATGKISLWAIATILFLLLSKSDSQSKPQLQQKQSHQVDTNR